MAPQRLLASFVLVLLLPAAAILWLGLRLLDQDRSLESRQLQERRASACDRVTATLEQALAATERRLGSLQPEGDAVEMAFVGDHIDGQPPGRLLYYPRRKSAAGSRAICICYRRRAGILQQRREGSFRYIHSIHRKTSQ
jgi:hypothetical protein